MMLYIVLSCVAVLALLFIVLVRLDKTFVVANWLFNNANSLEAKRAGLHVVTGHNKQFEVTTSYLTNVATFDNKKPIIVLLHGFSADKHIWNRMALRLGKKYQLFIPDLLGHGETEYNPEHNYSSKTQCKYLWQLLDDAGIHNFHVIGNSMGGLMCAHMLNTDAERILKSVLIDPAGIRSDFSLQMAKTNQNPFNHYNEKDFFYFYDLVMSKPPYMPRFILRALAHRYIGRREQYVHMFRDFFNPDDFYEPGEHKIEQSDTMLIWGVNDKLMPVEDYLIWQDMLNSETLIYEDLGHMPMVEDVKMVSRDILKFLAI